ncbi:hypothetical protein GGTG_10372 [Gaeumannomyces tritici R3-111a-1]|uniref:Uncharacterized protein n=1 Tax=Gaeumannomyces tritici (strain R3-111a-1) TaxID=644352 RepID=J3PA47_GAET3|nr:hypothetical protein GGTG_10372 [Gaeumannomyces tritici R3-111a-1]EJT71112.1 hypothetical protein GGTG_10372 [Gaeumannomyces tritici R3-111a-1]
MPYPKELKPLETTSLLLALQSLPPKSLAPKAAPPGANTDAAPSRGAARLASSFALNALLNNGLTFVARKLFGRHGIKGFGFLNGFTGAKLGFNKLFEKLRYRFGQPFVNGPRTIIEAYRYTGVDGIILICLTTKTAAIKYRPNVQKERPNTDYLRLQSLKLLEWLLNAQKGKKRARSFEREKKPFIYQHGPIFPNATKPYSRFL